VPTAKVPSTAPSLARSLVTMLPPVFVTQMLAPSKATPRGSGSTANVPSVVPSLARSLVTLLLSKFVTQMLAPSKATPYGLTPTAKLVGWLPSYQESRPTWSGLKYVPETTPLAANCVGASSAPCAFELAGNIKPVATAINRTELTLLKPCLF